MAFTYDTSTDIGKIRLEIGDATENKGIKPDSTNFSDAELQLLITRESTWGRAAAAALEIAARWWARVPNYSLGPRSEQPQGVAEMLRQQAKELRAVYGGGAVVGSTGMIRDDAYHTYNEQELDEDTSEYESRTVYIVV